MTPKANNQTSCFFSMTDEICAEISQYFALKITAEIKAYTYSGVFNSTALEKNEINRIKDIQKVTSQYICSILHFCFCLPKYNFLFFFKFDLQWNRFVLLLQRFCMLSYMSKGLNWDVLLYYLQKSRNCRNTMSLKSFLYSFMFESNFPYAKNFEFKYSFKTFYLRD